MPRRASIARGRPSTRPIPANRTTARFHAKLMTNGKRNLADRILRQALARAEAQAHRPGLEVLEAALRNATPIIEVKPRRVGGATYQVPVEIRGDRRHVARRALARPGGPQAQRQEHEREARGRVRRRYERPP